MNKILERDYDTVAPEVQLLASLGTFHTIAFIIPANLENYEWCLIAALILIACQSIRNF